MKTNFWKTLSAAMIIAASWSLLPAARAQQTLPAEPKPDWMTLVFPTLVTKAGNTTAQATQLAPGNIRISYETRYENYWKETSYYRFDPATGDKIRGFYANTKTYGYVQMPWPIQPRGASALGTMAGDTRAAGRRYSTLAQNYRWTASYQPYVEDAADADTVWTPGESFNDADGDRQWDPPTPAEDYWNNDNTEQFLQRRDAAGTKLGVLGFPVFPASYRNTVQNDANYSDQAGELFADYNGSHPDAIAVGALGYDQAVDIWVAVGGNQVQLTINELDLTPESIANSNDGDFNHTYVQSAIVGGTIRANIARNAEFDYSADVNGSPQVRTATYINGTPLYVRYNAYVLTNATTEVAGYVYTYNDVWQGVGVPPAATATEGYRVRQVRVNVYQARELYGLYRGSPNPSANEYGDVQANPLNIRVVAADSQWTASSPGEAYEDFVSINNSFVDWQAKPAAYGAVVVDANSGQIQTAGSANARPGRGAMGWPDYERYVRWNYPGDATALLSRTGNGRYDGPENWTNDSNNKMQVVGQIGIKTPEPAPWDPVTRLGNWDADLGYATWKDWYQDAFGNGVTAAPNYWQDDPITPAIESTPQGIPSLTAYTPVDEPNAGVGGWIPVNTWSYDSPREFCDMPSSIYHLGGDVANAISFVNIAGNPMMHVPAEPGDVDVFAPLVGQLQPIRMLGGDYAIGEITSPFNDLNFGQDLHPDSPTGDVPTGPDESIPAAGPFMFNTIAGNAYDGANQLTMEFLTWRTDGDPDLDEHPRVLRDTNLDGILDCGSSRVGDPYYNDGDDGSGSNRSFNRQRYMEDVIAIWDQMENFQTILDMKTDPRGIYAYPIYPVNPNPATNAGWHGMGGPAGANIDIFTRDTGAVAFNIVFQVRPLNGATGAEEGPFPAGGDTPNVEPAIQDYGMGLLCHEQGHDIFGLPDLYDYDVWQNPRGILNSPIAGYDLMAGGFVHGVADMKEACGWTTPIDLTTVVPVGLPVILEMYPVERMPDNYYRLRNPANPQEYLDLWFMDNRNAAEEGPSDPPGGRGLYICHVDRYGDPNSLPRQQRVNGHFVWEIIQADGLNQLQDGVNSGDTGDPFPGATGNSTFTPNTTPASRWWDMADTGLRILDIKLPTAPWQPALVTIQRVNTGNPLVYDRGGADTDADGLPDWWELQFFQNLNVVGAATDWDGDGLSDNGEYLSGMNPRLRDTDGDGVLDGFEDTDTDGMNNQEEMARGLDPASTDTDDDRLGDAAELADPVNMDPSDFSLPFEQRALVFTGNANTYLRMPQVNGDTRFNNGSLTVEAWVSPTEDIIGAGGTIYSRQWTTGMAQSFRLGVNPSGQLYAEYVWGANVQVITSAVSLPMETAPFPAAASRWTHVAASFNETTKDLKIYLNGAEAATRRIVNAGAWTNTVPTPPAQRIGAGFRGAIDEVRVFNIARQPLNLGPLAGTEAGLVAYYKMDDSTSSTPGADLLWGTADDTKPTRGQIADTLRPDDWVEGWRNSASLVSGAVDALQIVDLVALFPYVSIDPTGAMAQDSDGDGLPDGWEFYHFGDLQTASEMTDADEDGLTDVNEQRVGSDPNNPDTDGDTIPDGQEDSDGDGLTNAYEQDVAGTHIGRADTDDDGLTDYEEVTGLDAAATAVVPSGVSDPINGFSPFRQLSAVFDGTGCMEIPDQAYHTLSSWTVQAYVRPEAGADGVLIRRALNNTDLPATIVNYQLGVYTSGGAIVPYVEFSGRNAGNAIVVTRTDGLGASPTHVRGSAYVGRTPALPVGEWTHLAASYDASANRLSLFINGELAVYRTDAFPLSGLGLDNGKTYAGQTTVGGGPLVGAVTQNGFEGAMDDVVILGGARTEAELLADLQSDQPQWAGNSSYGSAAPSPLAPDVAAVQQYVARQVVVRVKDGMTADQVRAWAAARNYKILRSLRTLPIYTLEVAQADMRAALTGLRADANIVYAEPNYKRSPRRMPNDAHFAQQWGAHNTGQQHSSEDGTPITGTADADIDAPEAWDRLVGSSNVVVAVFDTGIDTSHPDLAGALWTNPGEIPGNGLDDDGNGYVDDIHGYNFADKTGTLTDTDGHGTHVAGIIAATGGNGIGIAGVNWRARLMTLQIAGEDADASYSIDTILAAYDYAARMGVRISNHSYGGFVYSQAEYDMIKHMRSLNHLIVVAAGNEVNDNDAVHSYPDGYSLENIISVAATDHNDALADFSNFGATTVDLAAPGVEILSTISSQAAIPTLIEGYWFMSGTSMAAPQVTGVASLILTQNPALSYAAIKQRILSSVDKLAALAGITVTGGRLNAAAAVAGRGAALAAFTFDDEGQTAEDLTTWRDWLAGWAHAGIFHGATLSSAQSYVSQVDSDGDGLPDAWESAFGLDRFDATGDNGADGDPDGDGLTNEEEKLLGTSPKLADTNRDGYADGQGDADHDDLTDIEELHVYGTNPMMADTDDDNVNDGVELNALVAKADGRTLTSPVYSRSPLVQRALALNGTAITLPAGVNLWDADRFDVAAWTLEAWVRPATATQTGSVVKRTVSATGRTAFDLRLDANVPKVQFETSAGTIVTAGGTVALPANEWTHLAGVWDPANKTLQLYVNGVSYRAQTSLNIPAAGAGTTVIGDGVRGNLDELRVWNVARTAAEIADNRDRILNTPSALTTLIANYRFDDGGVSAEDYMHLLNWDYAITNTAMTDNPAILPLLGPAIPLLGLDDADNDGMPTWWENLFGAPLDPAVADNTLDPDVDGLTNLFEYYADTNPRDRDTDNDGVLDGQEDTDNDGLQNLQEQTVGSDPSLKDTDDDGIEDATDKNPASALSPVGDRVLSLDGALTSYVEMPNHMRFALSNFTAQAWVNPTATGGTILAREVQAGIYNYVLRLNAARPELSFSPADGSPAVVLTSPTSLSLGKWAHVAGTFDATTGRLTIYVNGVQSATMLTVKRPATNGVGPERVRAGAGFTGLMDEAALFNAPLASTTITTLMSGIYAAAAADTTALIAYYRFDDGTHATATSAKTDWTWGQVQDFASIVSQQDWNNFWYNAGTLRGAAAMVNSAVDAPVRPSLYDTNKDGLPDLWELDNGFDPTGASIAGADPDGDGLPNIAEYKAMTNPNVFDTWGSGLSDYDTLMRGPTGVQLLDPVSTYGEIFDDGDNMPYSYEILYKGILDPEQYDAHLDPDGDGWDNLSEYLAGTNPTLASSKPLPTVNARIEYYGTKPTVVRWIAWDNAAMNGLPIATGTVSDPIIGDVTLVVDANAQGVPSGALRGGSNYFLFYADTNNDSAFSTGEPAGFPDQQPSIISYGVVNGMRVVLRASQPIGYQRVFWTAAAGVTKYLVQIRNMSANNAPTIVERVVENRNYLDEYDLQQLGTTFKYELPTNGAPYPQYQYIVWNYQSGVKTAQVTTGEFSWNWNSTPAVPASLQPSGSVMRSARADLSWTHPGTYATRFSIEIRPGSTSASPIFSQTIAAPAPNTDGRMSYRLPMFIGEAPLTPGTYYWRVQASNPYHASAWSAFQSFSVDLTGQVSGPYSISGKLWYMGRANPQNIIVQAFASVSFVGQPAGQTRIQGAGPWTIPGLNQGTYYVRAFMDVNGNSAYDSWEPLGILKSPDPYNEVYTVKAVAVGPNSTGQWLILRDVDTDNDQFSDAWEWQKYGNLTTVSANSIVTYALFSTERGVAFGSGFIPLNTNLDSDGDGVSDAIEMLLGLDPYVAGADSDADGVTDEIEVYLGLDPTATPGSPTGSWLLKITDMAPNQSWIEFNLTPSLPALQARIGVEVEYSTDMINWFTLPGTYVEVGPGSGPWYTSPGVATAPPALFYRLKWYPLVPTVP